MRLINKGTNPLKHGKISLAKGAVADVPDEIAKIWLEIRGVEAYVAPVDVEKAKAEAQAKAEEEKKAYEVEIQKLKAELEKVKAEAQAKKTAK